MWSMQTLLKVLKETSSWPHIPIQLDFSLATRPKFHLIWKAFGFEVQMWACKDHILSCLAFCLCAFYIPPRKLPCIAEGLWRMKYRCSSHTHTTIYFYALTCQSFAGPKFIYPLPWVNSYLERLGWLSWHIFSTASCFTVTVWQPISKPVNPPECRLPGALSGHEASARRQTAKQTLQPRDGGREGKMRLERLCWCWRGWRGWWGNASLPQRFLTAHLP